LAPPRNRGESPKAAGLIHGKKLIGSLWGTIKVSKERRLHDASKTPPLRVNRFAEELTSNASIE